MRYPIFGILTDGRAANTFPLRLNVSVTRVGLYAGLGDVGMTGTTARGVNRWGSHGTPAAVRLGLTALCILLLVPVAAWSQGSTTASVRGNIQDATGAVLPGASVTMTNTGTNTPSTTVSDDRGQYFIAGLFPGTYDMKVELAGFKTYEQKAIVLSPTDNRGIDIRLEVGQQAETVTVTGQTEVIQTETGAREGVLTAKQIDNLSVIGRSSLELLRILPGVVAPDQAAMESVSFGGGANTTHGLYGQRHPLHGNTVSARRREPDRHRIEQRRHRHPEQRHGSGSEGPELELRCRVRRRAA